MILESTADSKVRSRRLFEAARDRIRIVDPDARRIIEVNPYLMELMSIERDYLWGKELAEVVKELSSALSPVLMAVELLRSDSRSVSSRNENLDTIEESCRRGTSLVRKLRDIANEAAGQRTAIAIPELIDDVVKILRQTFPENIEIASWSGEELWLLHGDSMQLRHALLNVAVTACDAMPAGGRITISAENALQDQQPGVRFVRGEGTRFVAFHLKAIRQGDPAKLSERLFEPFLAATESEKEAGLSVSAVRAIVRNHDGFVAIDSEPGNGASFRLYLPAAPLREIAEAQPRFSAPQERGR